MSTPFDINVPVEKGADVVLNLEDGTQFVGTGKELETAVAKDQIIGLHANPAVITPTPEEDEPVADTTKKAKK